MAARLIRIFSILAFLCCATVMLYPHKRLLGVNLSNVGLQAGLFGIYLILRVLALIGHLRSDPILQYRSNIWAFDHQALRPRVQRGVIELLFTAALMESAQFLIPDRVGRLSEFAVNGAVIVIVGVVIFLVLRFLLHSRFGNHLVQRMTTLDA